jgi:two-component sensor histidine kinase
MTDAQQSPAPLDDDFEPTAVAATQIRHRLKALLGYWRVRDAKAEDTLLVVHELVANVVDHARTPFHLGVRLCGSVVKIWIHDESTGTPQMRQLDVESYRGRGLRMIATLSERWGFQASDDGDGKTVWADIKI